MSLGDGPQKAIQGLVQAAVHKAVELAPERWIPGGVPDPLIERKHSPIGAPLSRVDGPLKVRGKATFAAEVRLEGMVYASLACSTIAKGRIVDHDTRAAEAAPGVVQVMTYRNCPRLRTIPHAFAIGMELSNAGDDLPVMQDEQIHWNGQPIALVLAETQEQADHARSLIRVRYEPAAAVTAFETAKAMGTETAEFFGARLNNVIGDADAALAAAPFKIDRLYRTPRLNPNAMEPHAITVLWEGDRLVAYDSTQGLAYSQWGYSQAFGIDEGKIRLIAPFVGGAFGAKGMWQHQVLAAAASRLLGRPVRLALSREGVYRIVGGRTCTEQRVAIGAQRDGRFDALIHTGYVAQSHHNNLPEPFIYPAQHLYGAGSFKLDLQNVRLDMLANTSVRAPGESVGSFALESAIDELAGELGMDPIELRVRNEPDKDPTSGRPFSSRHLIETFRTGAARFGWDQRAPTPRARREGEWLIGMGVAATTYPYYRFNNSAIRITLTNDGCAKVACAASEVGTGPATMLTLVAAARLGLPTASITVDIGDTTLPGTFIAGGSQQTAAIGAALIVAQRQLIEQLLKLIGHDSPLNGLKADEVGTIDGGLCKLDEPTRHQSYVSILSSASRDEISVQGTAAQPLELMRWPMHSFGAMFCEVGVNAVTGETRVRRFLGSFDCGRIISAKTAASQFRGGIIMGLGLALMEETHFDERTGRVVNPSLSEYHLPVHMDVPEIDVIWTDIPDPHTPAGARGVGEIGIVGVAAAVANAVYNATGKRVRELPITLDKLLG